MRIGVVGAGPAGLLFSSLVRSHEVEVYEEHRAVGWPPHCTGLVSPATAQRLAFHAGREIIGARYDAARILSGSRPVAEIHGSPLAVRVKRPLLEELLAAKAGDLSHRLHLGVRVTEIDPYRGLIKAGGGKKQYDLIVVAAGPEPWRIRGAGCGARPILLNGLQATAALQRRPNEDVFEVVYSPHVSRWMFGWIVPLGRRRVLVGVADKGSAYPGLRVLLHLVETRYGVAGIEGFFGGKVLRGPPCPRPLKGKAILIGDSAGLVKPYTGGGLYGISVSVPLAARSVEKGDPQRYLRETRWLRRKLRIQGLLTRLASLLGPGVSSAMLGAVGGSKTGSEILDCLDYDSHEQVLTRLALRLPLVLAESLLHKT